MSCQHNYVSPLTESWGHIALPLSAQFVGSAFVCAFPPIVQGVKHETLTQYWANVGPPSATLAQHQTSTGSTSQSVSLCCGESVSDSFLPSAFYGTGGQTQDVDPMLD